MTSTFKTTAVFLHSFELEGFDEVLPAGDYEIETELPAPVELAHSKRGVPAVLVRLHARDSHPGLARTLTIPLAEFERASAKDKLSGRDLKDFFLEEMLADPMTRLVMAADGVSEAEVRDLYFGRLSGDPEAERWRGLSPRPGSSRPGIGE